MMGFELSNSGLRAHVVDIPLGEFPFPARGLQFANDGAETSHTCGVICLMFLLHPRQGLWLDVVHLKCLLLPP